MHISKVTLNNYKRFSDLEISGLGNKIKLVVIVGPNGSGKSSLFDAFITWHRSHAGMNYNTDELYYKKHKQLPFQWGRSVLIEFHEGSSFKPAELKNCVYVRSAYRNEADFNVSSLGRMGSPVEKPRINNLIQNDLTVQDNYQRLISNTLAGVFSEDNDTKTVADLREALIGRIRNSLNNIFDDINLNNIGDPLHDGNFYFEKGASKRFHYKNLSGGEKSVFDLIIDIIIKSEYFSNTVYCIDEPEAHMHTKLQALFLEELYRLIPDNCQLWISTHSLGMMKKAKELQEKKPETVAFLDFGNRDFDSPTIITPSVIDREIWERFISLALDNMSGVQGPETLVLCEGDKRGRKYRDFDAQIMNKIFKIELPNTYFVSIGSAHEVEDEQNKVYLTLKEILPNSKIWFTSSLK